jgi:hypothetical protein
MDFSSLLGKLSDDEKDYFRILHSEYKVFINPLEYKTKTKCMSERANITLKLFGTHILLVPFLIVLSLVMSTQSLLLLSVSVTVLIITFFTGYWEFFNVKFKWTYTISLTAVIILMFIWQIESHQQNLNGIVFILLSLLQLYLIFHLVKIWFTIFEKGQNPFEIEFPLNNGKYLITDGGNSKVSRLMNYHYYSPIHKKNKTNRSMLYATDLVKITESREKLLPENNEDYPIFSENVYSPMEGTVFKIVNGISDNKPFSGNYPYNTGNTIVIKNNDYYFLLGHLKFDSIQVNEGDRVSKGHCIAKIGNSGWTERPHLHMQLIKSENENYWNGVGVCIKYKNKNLYKNRIIDMPVV